MQITLESYINPHSRLVGRKTETINVRDIETVIVERSSWVDEDLVRVKFKNSPSCYFSRKDFVETLKNLYHGY